MGLYRHDYAEVSRVITNLRNIVDEYNSKITELSKLVSTISQSSSWVDVDVKTEFVSNCNSYILLYKNFIININGYIEYLSKKSEEALEIENSYA